MRRRRFDDLIDYVRRIYPEAGPEALSVEALGYRVPKYLYGDLVAFRHLNQADRERACRPRAES